jgi:hypothetical protein
MVSRLIWGRLAHGAGRSDTIFCAPLSSWSLNAFAVEKFSNMTRGLNDSCESFIGARLGPWSSRRLPFGGVAPLPPVTASDSESSTLQAGQL